MTLNRTYIHTSFGSVTTIAYVQESNKMIEVRLRDGRTMIVFRRHLW